VVFQKIGDGIRKFNKTDPTVLHKSAAYHLNRVRIEPFKHSAILLTNYDISPFVILGLLYRFVLYCFQVASDEKYAFIGDDASVDIAIATNCDLIKIKEHFIPLTNAFGFPDKSPHTRLFSEQ